VLFGSRAKGNCKPGSDVDIALKGDGLKFKDILEMSVELDQLGLPYMFDLVIYSRIDQKSPPDHIDRLGISLV